MVLNEDTVLSVENMLKLKRFCAVIFPNTTSALQAEKMLKKLGTLPFIITPIPSIISTGCGLSIKTPIECCEELVALLKEAGIPSGDVFKIDHETKAVDKIS